MISYVNGDLTNTPDRFIVQQVNCQGKMGSGLAKAIRDKWPEVYQSYMDYYNKYSNKIGALALLGSVNMCPLLNSDKIVYNLFGQFNYGKDGSLYTSYDAIDNGLSEVRDYLYVHTYDNDDTLKVSMPKIGCGLGGANWNIVKEIIDHRLHDVQVTIWEL